MKFKNSPWLGFGLAATAATILAAFALSSPATRAETPARPAALLATSGATGSALRLVAGFEPERLDRQTLEIQPGVLSTAQGERLVASKGIVLRMGSVGVGGIDRGAAKNNASYQIYIIENERTGTLDAVASEAVAYSKVALPAGYRMIRKLNFGFIYDRQRFGGIPAFHFAYSPKGLFTYTEADTSPDWMALRESRSGAFREISLARWIPDAARLARVLCITSSDGRPGKAYLRSISSQELGLQVGAVGADRDAEQSFTLDIRVTSTRDLAFRTTGGAQLTIIVLGYSMTEPS